MALNQFNRNNLLEPKPQERPQANYIKYNGKPCLTCKRADLLFCVTLEPGRRYQVTCQCGAKGAVGGSYDEAWEEWAGT